MRERDSRRNTGSIRDSSITSLERGGYDGMDCVNGIDLEINRGEIDGLIGPCHLYTDLPAGKSV